MLLLEEQNDFLKVYLEEEIRKIRIDRQNLKNKLLIQNDIYLENINRLKDDFNEEIYILNQKKERDKLDSLDSYLIKLLQKKEKIDKILIISNNDLNLINLNKNNLIIDYLKDIEKNNKLKKYLEHIYDTQIIINKSYIKNYQKIINETLQELLFKIIKNNKIISLEIKKNKFYFK